MILLFEEYAYDAAALSLVLDKRYFDLDKTGTKARTSFVGYFFNAAIQKSIFILPKVFLPYFSEKCSPEQFLQGKQNEFLSKNELAFVFQFSTWIYLAIRQFQKRNPQSFSSLFADWQAADLKNILENEAEIELILNLLKFHKENQSLFALIKKTNQSQKNTINWNKTFRKKTAFINQENCPIYLQTLQKNKNFSQDEELIKIYYSVLYELKKDYYFDLQLPVYYEVMKGAAFEKWKQNALSSLQKIKNNYHSDALAKLWRLLYAYFAKVGTSQSSSQQKALLLVKDFNLVFEDMIDLLLSEPNLPKALKEHKDGKRIDHIYPYQSLIGEDWIYFIGDSKYYKDDIEFHQNTIFKQFTYAKNVIQYNIELAKKGELPPSIRYRDELTEGYNITPNFFISSVVESLDFQQDKLTFRQVISQKNEHFDNRLFDRDTLHLQSYNINFLFVIAAYITQNQARKTAFQRKAKQLFYNQLIDFFNQKYDFYKITPKKSAEVFVKKHFQELNGKIYQPSNWEKEILLASEKGKEVDFSKIEKLELSSFQIG